jgi:hypothetical protein
VAVEHPGSQRVDQHGDHRDGAQRAHKGTSFCGSPGAAAKQRRALADRAM